ncbi:MAG: hypothetical protein ABL907_05285 [Hyphomicrobium sp.]
MAKSESGAKSSKAKLLKGPLESVNGSEVIIGVIASCAAWAIFEFTIYFMT